MTQDEIIKLAHEAGLHVATDVNWMPVIGLEYAEKFVNLATQHEQKEVERLRALCYEMQSELYAYRAANHLKNVTEHIRTKGLT